MKNVVLKLQKKQFCMSQKRCSVGTPYCTQCPNSSAKSQKDPSWHFAKKHSAPKPDVTFKYEICHQEFPGFYALRQDKNTQHGMQIGSGTRDVDEEHIVGDVQDHSLREELCSCQHFLVDYELERARLKVFNYAEEILNETIVTEKFFIIFSTIWNVQQNWIWFFVSIWKI